MLELSGPDQEEYRVEQYLKHLDLLLLFQLKYLLQDDAEAAQFAFLHQNHLNQYIDYMYTNIYITRVCISSRGICKVGDNVGDILDWIFSIS